MLDAPKVIFALVLLSMLAVTTVRADEATEHDGGDKGTGRSLRLGGRLYLDGVRTSPGFRLERAAFVTPGLSIDTALRANDETESTVESSRRETPFQSTIGVAQLRLGGRLFLDAAGFFPNDKLDEAEGPFVDDVEVRRARLNVRISVKERFRLKVAYDFAAEEFKSIYFELRKVSSTPLQRLRIGRTKEPFSLEKLTSSKNLTFMERSLANATEPSFSWGVLAGGTALDEGIAWSAGVFRNEDDFGDGPAENRLNYTGRASAAFGDHPEDRRLLHIGGAVSLRQPERRTLRLRQRPEAHLAPRLVDTGLFAAERALLLGLEAAVILGPLSFQSELIRADFEPPESGISAKAHALYVEGSYFLTGEHRLYRRSTGTFKGPLVPRARPGAFQVGLRYSVVDLDDPLLSGGRLDDWTLGVNWYWNRYSRLMVNYVAARLRDGGSTGILQLRLQANF